MNLTKLGCMTFSSVVLVVLLWASSGELWSGDASTVSLNESTTIDSSAFTTPDGVTGSSRHTSGFWQILDYVNGCITIPRMQSTDLTKSDDGRLHLEISQISATISVYYKDRPDPSLPITADSVLVPKEDFSFSTTNKPNFGPLVVNDRLCDVSFVSENGESLDLAQVVSYIFGKPSTNVAILQLYVQYSDAGGSLVHTASLFLRSDDGRARATTEI